MFKILFILTCLPIYGDFCAASQGSTSSTIISTTTEASTTTLTTSTSTTTTTTTSTTTATATSSSTTTNPTACKTCGTITHELGNANSIDFTSTVDEDATTGCSVMTIECTTTATGELVSLFYQGNTTPDTDNTDTITRTLTCNSDNEWHNALVTDAITTVECVSEILILAQTVCGAINVLKNDPTNSLDVTQTETTLADGSLQLTVECTSPTAGTTVTLIWNDGINGATPSTTNTIEATLSCGTNGVWELTQTDVTTGLPVTNEITDIECLFL
uniref:C6 domain-containing protein n=1 Tax=Parastrongyloides trichosuri TaxID=131310 RepID=A0A0N4ZQ04_PARTI